MGAMYATLGITDPRDFGDLPLDIQMFWQSWWAERIDRDYDRFDRIMNTF